MSQSVTFYLNGPYLNQQFFDQGKKGQDEEHFIFAVGEAIFVGWFTFEYIIRFIAAPQKWK